MAGICRYTEDGRLTIDNNVSERTLRHQAIGRKNWLFLGNEQAGPRAAVLFTILAGAKRHRIEPWTYLRELLLRLHDDDSNLDEMLPDRWAVQHPEAVLTYRLEESRRKAAARSRRRRYTRAIEQAPLICVHRPCLGRTLTDPTRFRQFDFADEYSGTDISRENRTLFGRPAKPENERFSGGSSVRIGGVRHSAFAGSDPSGGCRCFSLCRLLMNRMVWIRSPAKRHSHLHGASVP